MNEKEKNKIKSLISIKCCANKINFNEKKASLTFKLHFYFNEMFVSWSFSYYFYY